MPKGVASSPTVRAARVLEKALARIEKKLEGYTALHEQAAKLRRGINALRGSEEQPTVEGIDEGGVNHVVRRGRRVA